MEKEIRNAKRFARRVVIESGERIGRRSFDERHRGIEDDIQRLGEAILLLASIIEEGVENESPSLD